MKYLVDGEMRVRFRNFPIEADSAMEAESAVRDELTVLDVGDWVYDEDAEIDQVVQA